MNLPSVSFKNPEILPKTFWIDPKIPAVLRESFGVSFEMAPPKKVTSVHPNAKSAKVEWRFDIYFTSVNLHPTFTDSTFIFQLPKGAKRVKTLNARKELLRKNHKKISDMVGKKAIDFTLLSFSGKTVTLSNLKGKVVLIDFWASWCGPCRKELPYIQSLSEHLKDKGLVVLGINHEKKATAQSFFKKNHYTFTNLHDSKHSVAAKYHVLMIPSVFIINREGKVSAYLVGYHSKAELKKAIERAGLYKSK